ncbi:hypothetical protein ASD64_20115 [Mesorhizobium sp. Root157]|uniref:DUF6455 family protein n=1 Tax=Mesorhizobium sp. Root157 TaxID=1736477 RepID=UPI000712C8D4|nr:hypothetical protein ASD64_20115 [Mesorhizobium sp. Root157]
MQFGAQHWPQTDRVWRQFALMDLVMERMDVDQVLAARKSGGTAMAAARATCLSCPLHRECRSRLAHNCASTHLKQLCPNASFFEDCRRMRPQA